jgi:hypothetical protein
MTPSGSIDLDIDGVITIIKYLIGSHFLYYGMKIIQNNRCVNTKTIQVVLLTFVIAIFFAQAANVYSQSDNASSSSDINMFDEPARMSANASNSTAADNITVFDEPAPTKP